MQKSPRFDTLRTAGRGIGQILLQRNALSGAVMVIGLAVESPLRALAALVGCLVGSATARLAGYDRQAIADGLYGFNGALVALAATVFLHPGPVQLCAAIAGAVLSTWIAHLFARRSVTGYTAPFILTCWLLLGLARLLAPGLLLPTKDAAAASAPDLAGALFRHAGQVLFAGDGWLPGALFLAAVAIESRRTALYALTGAALPLAVAACTGPDSAAFNTGLYGYNAVLCAVALAGPARRDTAAAAAAALLSVALQSAGMRAGIPTLTAPFVLSVWIVTALRRRLEK